LKSYEKVLLFPKLLCRFVKLAGWRPALIWTHYRFREALGIPPSKTSEPLVEPETLALQPSGSRHPLIVRLQGSSDIRVFAQIFIVEEYACLLDLSPAPQVILDLGANVGYSSAYFLSRFPNATVIAVEPDPGTFECCRKNLEPYGDRAKLILGAIWSERSRLVLSRCNFGDWATQVRKTEGQEETPVEAWDVPSILESARCEHVDLLKVDIEWSELAVFDSSSAAWLPKVRNICIELHGDDCREVFFKALLNFDYDLSTSAELTICRNLSRKSEASRSASAPLS
jgi:FkbM family methyltransferase